MGRFEELELERSVHLQIIEELKSQLQLQQVDPYSSSRASYPYGQKFPNIYIVGLLDFTFQNFLCSFYTSCFSKYSKLSRRKARSSNGVSVATT